MNLITHHTEYIWTILIRSYSSRNQITRKNTLLLLSKLSALLTVCIFTAQSVPSFQRLLNWLVITITYVLINDHHLNYEILISESFLYYFLLHSIQDGEDLPAVIGFEVEESLPIPASLPSYLPDDVAKFATDFVAQFYTLYDSSDRSKLIDGYHESASFSFSILKSLDREQPSAPFPRELIQESRNLTRISNPEERNKLLRQGKVAVVAAINSLPQTTHINDSFIVDVPFYSNVLVNIVVSGMFVELWRGFKQTRSFTRTFVIVPQENGYFIVNDVFMVGNSTHSQRQRFPAPKMSITSSSTSFSSGSGDDLASQISQMTGMTMKMSKQLLAESNQNVETALAMFKELNDRGAIPQEAFK